MTLASAPPRAPAPALQDFGATAATPTSWGDIVKAEKEWEQAGHSAASKDIRPILKDMDLIIAARLAHPDQVERVTDRIAQSFRTDLNRTGIQAMLYLFCNQQQYLGNFFCERILHGFLQGNTTEKILTSIYTLLQHFREHRRE